MFANLDEHSDLMKRMAKHTGVDLTQGLVSGEIGAMEYRDRVIRCSHCSKTEACRNFLRATAIARPQAPDFCANRDLFGERAKSR